MFSSHILLYFNLTCLMFDTTNIYHCLWICLPMPGQDMLNFKCTQNLQYFWTKHTLKVVKHYSQSTLKWSHRQEGPPTLAAPPQSAETKVSQLQQVHCGRNMQELKWNLGFEFPANSILTFLVYSSPEQDFIKKTPTQWQWCDIHHHKQWLVHLEDHVAIVKDVCEIILKI